MQQKSTLICPSEINYLNESEFKIDDNLLDELNAKIDTLTKDQYPKLQITQKNGNYFALNNTMLFVFQNLEQKRKIDKIYCELISLDKVPVYLQKEMSLGSDDCLASSSSSCCSECLRNDNDNNNTITTLISGTNQNCSQSDNENDNDNEQLIDYLSYSSGSDLEDEFDEHDGKRGGSLMSCNYCNQTFSSIKELRNHKLRKKHFGKLKF